MKKSLDYKMAIAANYASKAASLRGHFTGDPRNFSRDDGSWYTAATCRKCGAVIFGEHDGAFSGLAYDKNCPEATDFQIARKYREAS